MNAQAPHYEATMAAILKLAEFQAMGAEFREKLNDVGNYAALLKAKLDDEVIPAILNAAGDNPKPNAQAALEVCQQISSVALDIETNGAIARLRDDILEGDVIGNSYEAVSNMESYSFVI